MLDDDVGQLSVQIARFVHATDDTCRLSSLSLQQLLIPSVQATYSNSFNGGDIKHSFVGLLCDINPEDVAAVRALFLTVLRFLPGSSAREQLRTSSNSFSRRRCHSTFACTVKLLLVRLPSLKLRKTVSSQLHVSNMTVSGEATGTCRHLHATVESMAVIDRRAAAPFYTAPVVVGMTQDTFGLDVTYNEEDSRMAVDGVFHQFEL